MSLDFYLYETEKDFLDDNAEEIFWANITHNLGPMWNEAGVYAALYETNGQQAKMIQATLEKGLVKMVLDRPRFEKHNSPNGWGLYKNALPFLQEVHEACKENPEAFIRISR